MLYWQTILVRFLSLSGEEYDEEIDCSDDPDADDVFW